MAFGLLFCAVENTLLYYSREVQSHSPLWGMRGSENDSSSPTMAPVDTARALVNIPVRSVPFLRQQYGRSGLRLQIPT